LAKLKNRNYPGRSFCGYSFGQGFDQKMVALHGDVQVKTWLYRWRLSASWRC